MLTEFKEFALRGNVLDMAVGIVIGAAFTGIVNSLVTDVINPVFGLVLRNVDLASLYVNLSGGEFATLADAEAAGAAVLKYGVFITRIIEFLIVAFAIFLVIKWINSLRRRKEAEPSSAAETPATRACPFCLSQIPSGATRCAACTSEITPAV
jgi:large conductance mechanosensitive channel